MTEIQRRNFLPLALLVLAFTANSTWGQKASSKTPPQGPPWVQDFMQARELALLSGKAIFLYSTKTY